MPVSIPQRLRVDLSAFLLKEITDGTPIEQVSLGLLDMGATAAFVRGLDEVTLMAFMPRIMATARQHVEMAALRVEQLQAGAAN